MNPRVGHPEQVPIKSDIWNVLDRLPGTECREALELIYRWACCIEGIVVLSRPSARVAVSAVLGALKSESSHGPARVFIEDPSRQQLKFLFGELSKINLASEVTLYHGALSQFFRDLPMSADLICADSGALDLVALGGLRSAIPAGTVILTLSRASSEADQAAAQYLVDGGILELEVVSTGGATYRATQLCHGTSFTPRAGLRVRLQGKLHERYFLSEAAADTDHTPIADLAEDIRREFSREFPAASGSAAWPYAAPESTGLPLTLPSGKRWPKVSIVTPTRNQGQYLEETILSVLHQDYPNVEHIIVDGASTDETPSILERYRDKLALVISEPDNGQSHAINKGMSRATGDIVTWLNSDDMLAPGALASVALALDLNGADMIAGICRLYRDGCLDAQHLTSCADGPLPLGDLLDLDRSWHAGQFFIQPEVMFTREIWLRVGGRVDERLLYTMDYDLWLRFARAGARLHVVGRPLAWFRLHEEQKIHASSSVRRELAACRDAFLRENNINSKPVVIGAPWREKLRIALLNDSGGFHGAGIANIRLANALAWAGHDVSMVAILDAPEQGMDPLQFRSESVLDRVSASLPDLVIVGNLRGANADPLLLHLLAKRFPTLVVLPDEYPTLPPAQWQLLGTRARTALLTSSEWAAEVACKALGGASSPNKRAPSVEVIRLSFPLDVLRPRNKQACREHLGLPTDRFIVLLAGSFHEAESGGGALLEALARLELPNILVVTVGGTGTASNCPIELAPLGDINDQHELAVLNSAVDVVVVANSSEAFQQIYIEAIACGTPVAGYPVGAVPEAIREGVTGVLASDNNPASLAAAIHYLYVHPELRDDLAKWGRLYVENEWSEFSAYHHIFMVLDRLGLTKSLNLRRKIDFLPNTPQVPSFQTVWKGSASCF